MAKEEGVQEVVTRDIATLHTDAYSRSAPLVLGDLHNTLLETLELSVANNHPNILIVGAGGNVLPYSCKYTHEGELGSTNRKRMRRIVEQGKMIIGDYVVAEKQGGIEKQRNVLRTRGFFDAGFFREGAFNPRESIDAKSLEARSINFVQVNLKDNLAFADSSIDFVDLTLSAHHATTTRAELRRLCHELKRVTSSDAVVHIGEGDVNMGGFVEDKLLRLGNDLREILDSGVVIRDARSEDVRDYLLKRGVSYQDLPDAGLTYSHPQAIVKENGLIEIPVEPGKVAAKLLMKGYRQVCLEGGSVVIPIIDHQMPADAEFCDEVNDFYNRIRRRVTSGYGGRDNELVKRIFWGIADEELSVILGKGVDNYRKIEEWEVYLREAGFRTETVHYLDTRGSQVFSGPFYNLIAKKVE